MVVWLAGMAVSALSLFRPKPDVRELLRGYDRMVTTPAMLFTWLLGITLASYGGWFGEGWLWVKIAFVTLMSGLHGALAGRLRRSSAGDRSVSPREPRVFLMAGCAGLIAIVLLVVTKPG